MNITQKFLQAEIAALELERQKAINFQIQAQGVIDAYRMLLAKLAAPEPEPEKPDAN